VACRPAFSRFGAEGVPPDTVDELRTMLLFLDTMQDGDELRALMVRKPHPDRRPQRHMELERYVQSPPDLYCLLSNDERETCDLNSEDYHELWFLPDIRLITFLLMARMTRLPGLRKAHKNGSRPLQPVVS
jgi:hypothetical protein